MRLLLLFCALSVTIGSDLSDCDTLCKCEFLPSDTMVTCQGPLVYEVPKNLPANTTKLYLSGTSIRTVSPRAFAGLRKVTIIFFRDLDKTPCILETLSPGCFDNLADLRIIGIVRCHRLQEIKTGVFGSFDVLHTIQIYQSGLQNVPNFEKFRTRIDNYNGFMLEIDLSNNQIETIKEHEFMSVKTHQLKLNNNKLERIDDAAFYKSHIVNLELQNNPTLTNLGDHAFEQIESLEKLDLSKTSITSLPKKGLADVVELRLTGTKSLKQFPPVIHFNKIKVARLYYPHHCCLFKNPEKQNPTEWKAYMEFQKRVQQECSTTQPETQQTTDKFGLGFFDAISPPTRLKRYIENGHFSLNDSPKKVQLGFGNYVQDGNKTLMQEGNAEKAFGNFYDPNSTLSPTGYFALCGHVVKDYRQVICTPEPDAFNPCEDLMGYDWLRIFVWIVLLAALFGNSAVLLVLIKSRGKMTVTKFLMSNLAFADLMMGIYLLLLASIDAHTLNEYFNYAVIWQNEGGCQVAGFLTVFSCELSIFTLTIITLERWYAISHAIQLTKRIRIRQAMIFMAFGWLYALFMAHLPLVGISSYGHVSICLPMKVDEPIDVAYVVSLLVVNGVAFLCICGCYINMYCKVRGSQTNLRNNDATIAKRMAMLVFTNFACWAPIAFFGLTASAGIPLIDITNSKILLVFFYPLNSFANPYLYVIITKQFRKDMYVLLGKYGICTEKANRYRVTFTNSHSRNTLASGNGVKQKSTAIVKPTYSRPSNSESNCSTSTFIQNHTKHPSIRVRIPESSISEADPIDTCEASVDRRLKSPPPFSRNPTEYVMFFPPPRRDSYPKYKYQTGRQNVLDSGIGSAVSKPNSACNIGSDVEQAPLIPSDQSTSNEDFKKSKNVEGGDMFSGYELTKLSDVVNVPECTSKDGISKTDETINDELDNDSVQQTLLKHCTLRESPGMEKKCPSDSVLSDFLKDKNEINIISLCQSKSSSNIDDYDSVPSIEFKSESFPAN